MGYNNISQKYKQKQVQKKMEESQEQLLHREPQPLEQYKNPLHNKEMKVFLFEFLGMAIFAYGIVASNGSAAIIALFFLATVCFAAPFSGAHVNPAVTLAMLLCRKINFGLAMIYCIAQISGAFVGAFLCYLVLGNVASPQLQDPEWHWVVSDFCGEMLATFTFVTFILIQAHPDTTFTPGAQPLTTYCLVALSLYISRGYTTHSGGCLNPGMAISLTAFDSYHSGGQEDKMSNVWIWIFGPFCGAIIASVFYEQLFKRLHTQ